VRRFLHGAVLVLLLAALVATLLVGAWAVVALADKPTSPPGQGECEHGNSGQECRPDPQPDHGKDCEEHGNNGGTNEDHCAPVPPDVDPTPTPDPTLDPTPSPTPEPPVIVDPTPPVSVPPAVLAAPTARPARPALAHTGPEFLLYGFIVGCLLTTIGLRLRRR